MNNDDVQDLYGYKAPLEERIFKYIFKILLFLLRINGRNKISNWILEEVNPFILVKSKIDNLVSCNLIKEIEFFKSNYLASKDVNAWLGLYKVL